MRIKLNHSLETLRGIHSRISCFPRGLFKLAINTLGPFELIRIGLSPLLGTIDLASLVLKPLEWQGRVSLNDALGQVIVTPNPKSSLVIISCRARGR
jgi:hypothetical protein